MSTSPTPEPRKRLIQLPRTSTRLQRHVAHLKLLSSVRNVQGYGIEFQGEILAPGALIDRARLPRNAVLLECAGPIGETRGARRARETVWILWRYDWQREAWIEIARAASLDWQWALVLREPAIRALSAEPVLVDYVRHSREIVGAIMHEIDEHLEPEVPEIRVNVLASVYGQVAGRIASLA